MKGIPGNPVLDAYHRMAVSPVQGTTAVQGPAPAQTPPSGSESAEVTISALGRDLATGGTHDTAKVAELKARIAAGDFQIDPSHIAARLIDHASKGSE